VTFDEFPDAKFPLRNRSVEGGRGQDTESPGDWKNSPDKFHKFRESNEKIPSCAGPTLGPKVNKKIKRKKKYRTKRRRIDPTVREMGDDQIATGKREK
jgi:hypothetical protein